MAWVGKKGLFNGKIGIIGHLSTLGLLKTSLNKCHGGLKRPVAIQQKLTFENGYWLYF
jgi:hypothetical protein